ncbi:hypothetical protein COU58_00375 [Candidatus Pacearchaeota archaeon CG10_big_fil_rev_8_21_14_0_10_32_42]|nr:MAG: hypothetical protein COU58_00375 [Candidatus Pacearchaeota archaeon CG10_big_fil_rev_8_21_14_0_10_32_42]
MPTYIQEKRIEPINILVIFLLGLAATLFILGSITSFSIENNETLMIIVAVVYVIAIVAFLYPKKKETHIHTPEPEVIERETFVEKPFEKVVIQYRDRPVIQEVEKHIAVPIIKEKIIEKEKVEPKKSKYLGSKYNQRYHLRTCRFAGAIKKEYLVEEDEKKYFKLRGYVACKVCHPDEN